MMSDLQSLTASFKTSIDEDKAILQALTEGDETIRADAFRRHVLPMRLLSAVAYRLQRKELVQFQIEWCVALMSVESLWTSKSGVCILVWQISCV